MQSSTEPAPEKVECPSCGRPTPPLELAENSGVCRFCRHSFSVTHKLWKDGKAVPVRQAEIHEQTICDTSHLNDIGVDAEGGNVLTTDFDLDAIEPPPLDLSAEEMHRLGEAFGAILTWILRAGNGANDKLAKPGTVLLKLVAVASSLNPALLDNRTFRELGAWAGNYTKAIVSRHSLDFARAFGVHWRRSRPDGARANFQAAAIRGHATRRAKANGENGNGNGNGETH